MVGREEEHRGTKGKGNEEGPQDVQLIETKEEHAVITGRLVKYLHKVGHHTKHDTEAGQARINDEQEKVLVVVKADTVVDPGTVMIHFQYARATCPTVMRAIRFLMMALVTASNGTGFRTFIDQPAHVSNIFCFITIFTIFTQCSLMHTVIVIFSIFTIFMHFITRTQIR